MESIINFFDLLFNSEKIILTGGIALILLVVYLENGIIIAFLLPGDYLLFLSGLFCSSGLLDVHIAWLTGLIYIAAVLGCFTGYIFGKRVGYSLFNKKDSRLFKKKYLIDTEVFFKKYGPQSIIISRFLPVIRTFIPVLAGIVKFNSKQFLIFTLSGVGFWVSTLVLGGYFIGKKFPLLQNYAPLIIVFFLLITTFSLIKSWWVLKKKALAKSPENLDEC
jgi:membrane-associated protein